MSGDDHHGVKEMTITVLKKARREVAEKSDRQIDADTAWMWAYRAVAAYEYYARSGDPVDYARAEGFRDEAVEHAARGGILGAVEREVEELTRGLGRGVVGMVMARRGTRRVHRYEKRRAG